MKLGPHEKSRSSAPQSELFASFVLTEQIALGDLASITRARVVGEAGPGAHVIKRLRHHHAQNAEHRRLLLTTAHALLGVQLPHVLRVLDVREDPEPFVVLEFVEGASLAQCLRLSTPAQSARFVVPVLVEVLEGLHALHTHGSGHAAGFVHGAPVPRHVMIGLDGRARLSDHTHLVGPGIPWSQLHEHRLRPDEMAPEQALAPGHLDARCDVFVVGIVLWQALTGVSLFRSRAEPRASALGADTREATLQRMLRQLIVLPSEAGARFPSGLDEVCLRALQRARKERYGSALEFARALEGEAKRRGIYASREEIGAWVGRCLVAPDCPPAPVSDAPETRVRRGAVARRSRVSAAAELASSHGVQGDVAHTTLLEWPLALSSTSTRTAASVQRGPSARTVPSIEGSLDDEPALLLAEARPSVCSRVEPRPSTQRAAHRNEESRRGLVPRRWWVRPAQPLAGLAVAAAVLLTLFAVSRDQAQGELPEPLQGADEDTQAEDTQALRAGPPSAQAKVGASPQGSVQTLPELASPPRAAAPHGLSSPSALVHEHSGVPLPTATAAQRVPVERSPAASEMAASGGAVRAEVRGGARERNVEVRAGAGERNVEVRAGTRERKVEVRAGTRERNVEVRAGAREQPAAASAEVEPPAASERFGDLTIPKNPYD